MFKENSGAADETKGTGLGLGDAVVPLDDGPQFLWCLLYRRERISLFPRDVWLYPAGLGRLSAALGCVGPKYVRFSQFVRGPTTVYRHFLGLVKGRPEHHIGHNPAGAMAVVLLLLLGMISAVSGRLCYVETLRDPMEVIHGLVSDLMLIVVAGHVLGVVVMSLLSRENLVLSMLTGLKLGRPEQSIHGSRPVSALLLLLLIIGFWIMALPGSPFD